MTVRTGVIYLQKDKFQIFAPNLGTVLEFRFVPEIIRDLDVINTELLENLIKVFITNGKIAPCNLIIVLADNAYFTKDFLSTQPSTNTSPSNSASKELLEKQAEEFVEHVPFDNVVSKTLPVKNGIKVCATNKDFYEAIAIAFEHLGFKVDSVLPGLVLGNNLSARQLMDPSMVNVVLQKASTLRQYDLLNQQVFQPQFTQETEEVDEVELERGQSKKPNKKRLIALSGVFASLIVVLVIVYVQSQAPPTPPKQPALASNTTQTAPPAVNPTAIVSPTTEVPVVTLSIQQTQNLSVQIVNTSAASLTAKNLQTQLQQYQFKSVFLQAQNQVGSANTIVSFSPSVAQPVRDAVLNEVKKVKPNITVQERQQGNFDVTIVLGE